MANVVVLKASTDAVKYVTEGAGFMQTEVIAPAMKDTVIAMTAFAGPGETVEVVFTAPAKPGKYPYVCTFAGHCLAGMRGTSARPQCNSQKIVGSGFSRTS
jgi:azurin